MNTVQTKDHVKIVMFINHLSRDSLATAGSRKYFATESCSDAILSTRIPWHIPPENSKLHFSLIMKVSIKILGY